MTKQQSNRKLEHSKSAHKPVNIIRTIVPSTDSIVGQILPHNLLDDYMPLENAIQSNILEAQWSAKIGSNINSTSPQYVAFYGIQREWNKTIENAISAIIQKTEINEISRLRTGHKAQSINPYRCSLVMPYYPSMFRELEEWFRERYYVYCTSLIKGEILVCGHILCENSNDYDAKYDNALLENIKKNREVWIDKHTMTGIIKVIDIEDNNINVNVKSQYGDRRTVVGSYANSKDAQESEKQLFEQSIDLIADACESASDVKQEYLTGDSIEDKIVKFLLIENTNWYTAEQISMVLKHNVNQITNALDTSIKNIVNIINPFTMIKYYSYIEPDDSIASGNRLKDNG